MIGGLPPALVYFLVLISSPGLPRNSTLFLDQAPKPSIKHYHWLLQTCTGCVCCLENFMSHFLLLRFFGVTTQGLLLWLPIQSNYVNICMPQHQLISQPPNVSYDTSRAPLILAFTTRKAPSSSLPIVTRIGQGIQMIGGLPPALVYFLVLISSPGLPRNSTLFLDQAPKPSIEHYHWLLQTCTGCVCCLENFMSHFLLLRFFGMTTQGLLLWLPIQFTIPAPSMLKLTSILFGKKLPIRISNSTIFPPSISWPTSSPKVTQLLGFASSVTN
jgi:hypothetical protein